MVSALSQVIIDSGFAMNEKESKRVFRDEMNDWNYITVDIYTHLYREQTDINTLYNIISILCSPFAL